MSGADAESPWLTIVTVVKDDFEGFARTAGSLDGQDLDGVEWVVIDSSADRAGIPALIDRPAVYSWTAPSGVYPAMNQGLEVASGDYVLFLNAGDELASTVTLGVIRRAVDGQPVWLYGQVTFVSADGRRVTPEPFDYAREKAALFSRGRFPPHQGTVCRTATLRDLGGFDTTYRITADYALFLRVSMIADPVEIGEVIAVFAEGGLSSVRWQESLREFHRARREILGPTGARALRERLNTLDQYGRIGLARLARLAR